MNLMRKTLFFLVFLCTSFLLSAQQLPKTVLWRISGKGLSKPSYLFGTMHLNDQRLFNFGDSVYRAIERTEGLAIELNPDEICAEVMTQLFEENEKGKKLKDVLGEKDFKAYSEALEKKFGKSADEITARDLVREKNSWVNDLMEKGEMSTFMDAWLYNVARRQGKWLGGIEDLADQNGLQEELVDKSDVMYLLANDSTQDRENNAMLEQMVKLYVNQDLEGVEAVSGYKSAKEKDLVLIKRNVKMARRIDSLTALRSMFLAVGLAHLPGDSGVIKLLQKRGFKVEPVFSKKKIAAKDYQFKEVQIPWVSVKDGQDLYDVQMPGNPITKKYKDVVEMKFLFDLFNMSGFCAMAIVKPNMGNKDSMLNQVAAGFLKGKKPTEVRDLKRDGMKAREYFHKDDDGHMRIQVFLTDDVLYMLLMASVKELSLTSTDADKFFSSFSVNKNVKAPKAATAFTDSIMGVTMQSEVRLVANKKYSPETNPQFKITGFAATEMSNGIFVLLFSREVKPGYYISSDSISFAEFEQQMNDQYADLKKEVGTLQGHATMTVMGRNRENPELFARSMMVLKDNRNLLLMVIGDSAQMFNGSADMYFKTLRFINQPRGKWNFHNPPDKSYSVWTPTPLRPHINDGDHYQIAYDTLSSSTFFVSVDTLDKYVWYESDSSFWTAMIGEYPDPTMMVYNKATKNADFAGRETFGRLSSNGKVFNRLRLIPNGNLVYKIYSAASEQYLKSENVNKFFDSFRLNVPKLAPAYLQSKTKLLLNDLQGDSAGRSHAYNALNAARFTAADLPMLKQALFKEYQEVEDLGNNWDINYRLAGRIAELKDASLVDFIREQYPSFKKDQDQLKAAALSVLAQMPTEKSYTAFTELLLSSVPASASVPYRLQTGLKDSLSLTARFFPQLQKMAADSTYGSTITEVALACLDSGYIKLEMITADAYLKAARELERKMKKDPEFFQYWIYDLLSMAARFNSPEGNKLLLDFCNGHFNYLHKHAALLLLKNKQQVPSATFDSLAADRKLRTVLYSDLKELKKTGLYPKKYYTQGLFAESEIFQLANDDLKTSSIEFLQKKKGTVKGKTYVFYLYKVTYEGDESEFASYLGIAGGYDLTGKDPEYLKYMSSVISSEEFDANRIGDQFDAFLKRFEEEE